MYMVIISEFHSAVVCEDQVMDCCKQFIAHHLMAKQHEQMFNALSPMEFLRRETLAPLF
jgi:hypothetical protein